MERVVRFLAWPVAIVSGALVAAGLILLGLTFDRPPVALWGFRGFESIFAIETAVIGGLLMSRRPENVIGILFGLLGLTNGIQLLTSQYLVASDSGGLPLSDWVSWIYAFIWVPTIAILVGFVPLLFPDGHLVSPRWRWVALILAVGTVSGVGLSMIVRNAGGGGSTIPFPYTPPFSAEQMSGLWNFCYAMMGIGVIAAVASLWVRWRHALGVEREQLKWIAWAGGLVAIVIPFTFLPYKLVQVLFIVAVATVPAAVGIAILRYRLYEIDAVISRTLVYGALTAILAGLFAGVQRLLQGVFVAATGNESDAALVITTLILATAFAPLKAALERLVARRLKDPVPMSGRATDAVTSLATSSAGDAANDGAAVAGISPDDLEALLRRVVHEEVAAAMAGTSRADPEVAS